MYRVGHWGTHTGALHSLIMVESSPLRPLVYEVRINDQTAFVTDKFSSLIIMNKCMTSTFRALNCSFFKLSQFLFLFSLSDTFSYFLTFGFLDFFYFLNF